MNAQLDEEISRKKDNLIDCCNSCDTLILNSNSFDSEEVSGNSREIEEILTKSEMHWTEINNSDISFKEYLGCV